MVFEDVCPNLYVVCAARKKKKKIFLDLDETRFVVFFFAAELTSITSVPR